MEDLTIRFGETFDDPMSELMELRQTTTVQAYHAAFDGIISRLNLAPDYTVNCFVTGLEDDIRCLVKLFNP